MSIFKDPRRFEGWSRDKLHLYIEELEEQHANTREEKKTPPTGMREAAKIGMLAFNFVCCDMDGDAKKEDVDEYYNRLVDAVAKFDLKALTQPDALETAAKEVVDVERGELAAIAQELEEINTNLAKRLWAIIKTNSAPSTPTAVLSAAREVVKILKDGHQWSKIGPISRAWVDALATALEDMDNE